MKAQPLDLPEIDPVERETSQEYAYRRLRHALMTGAIRPGRSLTIRALAAYFGVSPTPVREALRRLSSENGLSALENRRIRVPLMTAQRFEELIALRCVLECHVVQRAVPYVTDVLIDELTELDLQQDHAVEAEDYATLATLNQQFHARIYRANPEDVALPMIESLWLQIGPFQRVAAEYVSEHYLVDRHKEILRALRVRDARAAVRAVEADIREGVGHLGKDALRKILGGA